MAGYSLVLRQYYVRAMFCFMIIGIFAGVYPYNYCHDYGRHWLRVDLAIHVLA